MHGKKTKYFFSVGITLLPALFLLAGQILPAADAQSAAALLLHCFPYAQQAPLQAALTQTVDTLFGFVPGQPETILKNQIALCAVTMQEDKVASQVPEPPQDAPAHPTLPIAETKQTAAALGSKQIYIDNDTNFDVDIPALLNEPLSLTTQKNAPSVLIVHTHTTESYTPDGQLQYSPEESTRTLDNTKNVVRIGEEIAQTLTEAGIGVLHDQTVNDHPSYNGAYTRTLANIENYLARYPSVQIVLDIHRDAMTKSDGTKLKLTADISGTKAAQLMLVVGTSEGGLPHEHWRENLKFALKLQDKLTAQFPGLARPINLRTERFNQHATPGSLIVEVGTDGNTLPEALTAARCFATVLAEQINSLP